MIAVVGGGITGLSTAYYLLKKGHNVTLFEADKQLGGLASSIKVGNEWVEKYYHHIFKYETDVQELCKELKIKINWHDSKVGMVYKDKIHAFGSATDLLKLEPISITGRFKLGLFSLAVPFIKDWKQLEKIPAEKWLLKYLDKRTYNVVWKPLLLNKFGKHYKQVPASYIWERLYMRTTSRSHPLEREKLGYIENSFQTLVDKLEKKILDLGGQIKTSTSVKEIIVKNRVVGGIKADKTYKTKTIVSTLPLPVFTKITKLPNDYQEKLSRIKYSGVICMILLLKNNLSDYYWTNIHNNYSFRLMVEHTNYIKKDFGSNIVYLSRYIPEQNPQMKMPNKQLLELYINDLKRLFPTFQTNWIKNYHVYKNPFSNPIISLNFSRKRPAMKTPIKNLYLIEKSQLSRLQQGTDNCVILAKRFMKYYQALDIK